MHSLSIRFIALWIIGVALAAPLGIDYDKTTGLTPDETANKARLDQATTDANVQITKMQEGLTKYKAGEKKATELFEAAFGKNADVDVVQKTVDSLQHGTLKAEVGTHVFKKGEIAAVPWKAQDKGKRKRGGPTWTPQNAQFRTGPNALNDEGRAATVIHEATHQLENTGDDVNKSGNKIIKSNDGSSKPSGDTGYTSNHNMHKTVAEVNADKAFTDVRDAAKNMHHNAESYALFGSLCSQPGALRRRDVHLYVRALLEGDDEQLYYLARDNECKLPPDYFAKKAAANKAAAAGAHPAPGGVHPVSDSKAAMHPTTGAGVTTAHDGKVATVHDTKVGSTAHVTKAGATHQGKAPTVHDTKAAHPHEHKPEAPAHAAKGAHPDNKQAAAHVSPKSPHANAHQASPKIKKTRRR